ncbi:PfkB family carbohydrate kinase [Herbiconiux sp. 11R-BC]|uniref:PfkB family carbohydrate kinase n=1 Tax=Herbiconiux sp. 11R-BC TaxID=3111637 RepID=UPI003BFE9C73
MPEDRSNATGTVWVFGSLNADTSYRMHALPHPGETVLAHSAQTSPGGKGANQAIASAAAGAPTRMIGLVGDDTEAETLLGALSARGVDTSRIARRPGTPTGRAVVAVDDRAENAIIVLAGANELLDAATVGASLRGIGAEDVLVLQNEVPAAANRAAATFARAAGATVVWNAAPAPATAADIVGDIDLLVVNEHELAQLAALLGVGDRDSGDGGDGDIDGVGGTGARDAQAGSGGLESLLRRTAKALAAAAFAPPPGHPRIPAAVCTLGSDGAVYVGASDTDSTATGTGTGDDTSAPDADSGRVASPRVLAVDTTAAGDTVVGYLAAHSHLPLGERLLLAGAAGAVTVTRTGASSSIPTLAEAELMLARTTERTPV